MTTNEDVECERVCEGDSRLNQIKILIEFIGLNDTQHKATETIADQLCLWQMAA